MLIYRLPCIENLLAKRTRSPLRGRTNDSLRLLTPLRSTLFRLHWGDASEQPRQYASLRLCLQLSGQGVARNQLLNKNDYY